MGKTNYVTAILGTVSESISFKIVPVAQGSAKPTPATGYKMSNLAFTDLGYDWYVEFQETAGIFTPT